MVLVVMVLVVMVLISTSPCHPVIILESDTAASVYTMRVSVWLINNCVLAFVKCGNSTTSNKLVP